MPLMDWASLRDLPALFSLGAHTVTHPDLTKLAAPDAEREVLDSRTEIEQKTGRPVTSFAYPYGTAKQDTAELVRREFTAGCGTRLDFAGPAADPAVLPRLDSFYLKSPHWFHRPFGLLNRCYIGSRRGLRELRQKDIIQ
jgi:hypothetical protein